MNNIRKEGTKIFVPGFYDYNFTQKFPNYSSYFVNKIKISCSQIGPKHKIFFLQRGATHCNVIEVNMAVYLQAILRLITILTSITSCCNGFKTIKTLNQHLGYL